ncbi:CocE/NonD family hydrolase [Pseudaminobacter sp. 19-2017]|uniref:CocE/NonD family hydrolase n=1 Tax=Pseudaminobacter soli (ex Zhang et al. 2022) TaxID=2831468 RepID=A0A942IB98_9HYPH|nr:CocE/NonD family hydrolase [Pseudaminobacter soli]MBS3652085.1 CocE/NonD family hydrolase [Pseudaminobacter soli]
MKQNNVAVEVIEHFVIPTRDGRKLSARVWKPVTTERLPVILEYIPYRKRDVTRYRDEPMHGYFARQGFVAVRLDLAGSGDSEGVLTDEYALQEQEDALDAIDWLSRQDWCSGAVGMIGKSWGGFNCLQIAARRPPALRAIIPVAATDDRYADDIHFMGGCLLVDGLDWGAVLQTFLPRPPDPALVGENWRSMWQERLDGLTCPLEDWLGHQRRDAFWKHGSICEDYSAITAATLLVGGWVDGYKTALMRMAEKLTCPTKCIMGPWAHVYPHDGVPAPQIGFLQEAVRWFDHFLKGVDNGVMEESKLRAYIVDSAPPQTHYEFREGRWIGEADWPSPNVQERRFNLTDAGLSVSPGTLSETTLPYNLLVGQFGGDWGAIAMPHEQAPDQRYDDSLSLTFDSEPLDEPMEILGNGRLDIKVAADKPLAQLAVRLSDVRPDGSVTKMAMGFLNLAHRDGSEFPEPLQPGAYYDVSVKLSAVGYRLPAGHRIRVSLSPSYWPVVWPSPERVELKVRDSGTLILPTRSGGEDGNVSFLPRETAGRVEMINIRPGREFQRSIVFDPVNNKVVRKLAGTGGYGAEGVNLIPDVGLVTENDAWREHSIVLDDPCSMVTEFHQTNSFQREDWDIRITSRIRVRSTREHFILNCELDVFENGERVLSRSWNPRISRDWV